MNHRDADDDDDEVVGFFFHLSFTVGLHQFTERRVPLDFELHHRAVLSRNLQVDVFVIFSLHTFLKRGTVRQSDEEGRHWVTETEISLHTILPRARVKLKP